MLYSFFSHIPPVIEAPEWLVDDGRNHKTILP